MWNVLEEWSLTVKHFNTFLIILSVLTSCVTTVACRSKSVNSLLWCVQGHSDIPAFESLRPTKQTRHSWSTVCWRKIVPWRKKPHIKKNEVSLVASFILNGSCLADDSERWDVGVSANAAAGRDFKTLAAAITSDEMGDNKKGDQCFTELDHL